MPTLVEVSNPPAAPAMNKNAIKNVQEIIQS